MPTAEIASELTTQLGEGERTSSAPSLTKLRLRRCVPYLVFALCASLYFLPLMRLVMGGTDEGILVTGALRTYQGQLLGRDFFEVVGPGTFYWLALFFKLFGPSFFASRICLFVTSLGSALALYSLSRRICRRYQLLPCVLVFSTYFATFWPEISHHIDSNFFALLAVCCIVLWRDSKNYMPVFFAGSLAGATALTIQPKGILLLLAFAIWIWMQRGEDRRWLRTIAVAGAGFLVVVGAMLGYFWLHGALGDLIYANVLWPARNYGPTYSVPYAFLLGEYFKHWIAPVPGFNWTIGMAAILFVPFLLVAALPLLLPLIAMLQGFRNLPREVALYWLAGAALWLSEIHRKDITHIASGSPLLIILFVYYLQRQARPVYHWSLQLLSIASVSLATAAMFISLVAHPLKTRVGTVHLANPDPGLTALMDHVPRGAKVFIYPHAPLDYFFSDTINPTRFSTFCFNPKVGSRFAVDEVIGDIETNRVRYVLWDQDLEKKIGRVFPGSATQRFVIAPYLNAHYSPIWAHDGVFLMERNHNDQGN
jgi:hypothetical protein